MSVIGILGGSGIYQIDNLTNKKWVRYESPFGEPSDDLLFGELHGQSIVFLSRHGRGHRIPPNDINYRANIDVLKRAGVTDLISISAVGSLKKELTLGTFVIIDQFIDHTRNRKNSFFETGCVAHVSMKNPVCNRLANLLEQAAINSHIKYVKGGTYITIDGPQFSTGAESQLYRSWNCDIIGMTNMPEAKLAREAEICYASIGTVTDHDDSVSVTQIIKTLSENVVNANNLLENAVLSIGQDLSSECPCHKALDGALMTNADFIDPEVTYKLSAIASRIL